MGHPVQSSSICRFGVFEADLTLREFRKHGIRIRLQEKPFQVLAELLRRPGEVVTRDELRQRLWPPDIYVDFEEGINTAVKRLRACLGDSSESPIYVETVSRYGYRFIAPVVTLADDYKPVVEAVSRPELVLVKLATGTGQSAPTRSLWDHPLLRLSLISALIVLAAFAIYGNWWHRGELAPATIQSIAVLPLQNLSGDPSQEYFADGITEEVTTALAKLSGPRVISRTSAMQYKGTHKSVPDIARDLNVGAIVEGSVERSANRIRVRVQLIEALTDQHLWAEEYDRNLSDLLGLEADVAQDIAEHIQLQLSEKQRQDLSHNRTTNPQAFQDYLQGRHYWALRTKESLHKAIDYFNRAIQEDPNGARSYAGLAHCYIVLPMMTLTSQAEAVEKAKDAARKAIALDDSLAEAHLAIAEVLLYNDWDFAGAETEFKKTLGLNPNYSTGHQWYGEFLSLMGRHEEAIREEQAALVLDPLSAVIHHQAGTTLRDAGHYEEAIQQYREAVKIDPNFLLAYEAMGWAFRREGKINESIQAFRASAPAFAFGKRDVREVVREVDSLQSAYNHGGRAAYLRQCLKAHNNGVRAHYYLARDYAELGERDAAIAELDLSYQNRDIEALWMLTDPELDSLRSDPRFQRLIRAVGFPH